MSGTSMPPQTSPPSPPQAADQPGYPNQIAQFSADSTVYLVAGAIELLAVILYLKHFRISCMNRGLCHRPGSGGQSPPRASIASAIAA